MCLSASKTGGARTLMAPALRSESGRWKVTDLLILLGSLATVTIFVTLFATSASAGASPSSHPELPGDGEGESSPALTATATPPDCVRAWSLVSSPNPGTEDLLQHVAAVSANDVWAVGFYGSNGAGATLVGHWDGTAWSVVPSPNQPSSNNILYGVAAGSASDVWAVGFYTNGSGPNQTLVEHWDGTTWAIVPSSSPGLSDNVLYSVAAVSANDVWTVGHYTTNGTGTTLVEHWDGTAWSVIASPNQGTYNNLLSVAAVSANDVWAVGYNNSVGALTEHWDGTVWSIVPTPPAVGDSFLVAVSALSANDVWAVGNHDGQSQTLVEHWDGTAWSVVPSPSPGSSDNELNGVAAVSANDVWAVGFYLGSQNYNTLVEHWDGTSWSVVPSPNYPILDNELNGVVAVSANDVWTVGDYYISHSPYTRGTLVEHYGDCTSTPTATITPAPPTSTPAAPTATITSISTPSPTTVPTCVPGWSMVASPDPDNAGFLFGVSVLAANDVWAVGDFSTVNGRQTLVEHWDGGSWSVVPSANHQSSGNRLTGVAAISANDVWAVGIYFSLPSARAKAQTQALALTMTGLIEHWDGAIWSIVPNPDLGSSRSELIGITAISANDVWAVGDYTNANGPGQTLVEHWNGTAWSIVPSANRPSTTHSLYAVAAVSANDVWAVGEYVLNDNSDKGSLVEHWDGTTWSIVPSPSQPSSFNHLYGVSVVSASDVWAVGYYGGQTGTLQQTLVEHWNGTSWSIVPSPNQGPSDNYLSGVAAISASDVWAVGYYTGDTTQPLEEHWDGTAWSVYGPSPGMSYSDTWAVAAVSTGDIWAVGAYEQNNQYSLTEHYAICSSTPTATASAVLTPSSTPTPTMPPLSTSTSVVASATPRGASPTRTEPTGTATSSPTITALETATSSPTSPGATSTPTTISSPTPCHLQFTDVPVGSTFYPYIHCLACLGIINGYSDGTFKPNNQVTRGQLSKIVSNSARFSDPQPNQMFQDVPLGSIFQVFIGRLASRGYIKGYPCGGPGEPCQPGNMPYFRPGNNATRGQISKIDANAAGFSDPPSGQQFEDVAVGSAFYTYTYRLVSRGVMGGYPCGGAGEPCVPPGSLPYFRPNNNATRGQTSKIVGNTFFADCQVR